MFLQDQSGIARAAGRVGRHARWVRDQGLRRVVEEDQANPLERIRLGLARARWRQRHGVEPGEAVAVFLVGVQRSGTNMVCRGLERSPSFEVHNENSRRAFDRYRLRDGAVASIVGASRQQFVLFKPLCDSHRIGDVVDGLARRELRPARILWAYRGVDGRVRSAVAKFGDVNLRVVRSLAVGLGDDWWQRGGLPDERIEEIARLDLDALSPEDGAALFWYLRNSVLFDTGLSERPDLLPVSYDALVDAPEEQMRAMCTFIGLPYSPVLVEHIDGRGGRPGPVELHRDVRALCEDLQDRLEAFRLAAAG